MLRARLSCDTGGEWRQRITSDIDVSYQYKRHHRISHANAGAIFRAHQEVLGVEHGPLIVVDLMHMDGGAQWLSIIAHGLVVDRVSWQIIVGHLEQVLDSKPVSPTPGMLYSDWCRLLEEHIGSTACLGSHRTPVAMMDYWGLTDTTNVYADVDVYEISLGREKTDLLLGSANDPIQTRPSELIQTALLLAFSKTFPGRSMPAIFIEDHSRDGWGANIDVAGTVGWLSSIYPCHVQVDASHDLVDMVRRLKDARRDAEDGGRFFMAAQRGQRIEMEILFSYGGASQKTGKPGSLFKPAPVCTRQLLGNGSHVVPFAPIVILAEVTDGQLLVQFTYSRSMKKAGAIIKWALQTYEALSTLAQQLPTLPRSLTRSDFPLLHLTDEHFEQFRTETINPFIRSGYAVVDAYSCSPIQHGILLTQAKNPQEYINRAVWTVRDRQGQPVDTDRLVHAWHKVVEKHSILRTVFMNSSRGDGSMDQVVIDDVRPDIVKLASTESDDPLEALPKYEDCIFPRLCPPHRLTVGRSATGAAACSWEVSHALVDGITTSVVLRDLLQAYDSLLPSETDRVYRAYISHLQRQLPEPCQAYWDKYTENLQPCFFPKLVTDTGHVWDSGVGHLNRTLAGVPGLRAFCQLHELTLATVFQVAWGLVLRAYARSDDVCYGYMTSGRDTPIQGIEEAAGPFINLLVRRMHFGEGLSTIAMLHKSQEEFARCLTYQYWPLASITHRHQGILFNSVMSVQSIMPSLLVPDSSLVFHEEEGHNATEYDLALHIETGRADVDVLLDYKQSLLADSEAEFVADAFEQVVQGIVNYFEQPAKSVPVLGGNSLKAVWEWNQAFPRSVERCVGDMILDNYRSKPYSPAVCAWDGSFTYAELEIHSARLSRRLSHDYGVGPEVFVPIYAIKSRWVTVAITAVIRAGGAFILLDPSHPLSRLRTICTSCQATVILALPQHQEMACKLVSRVATFGEEGLEAECSGESHGATEIATGLTPDNALYGIFTSGSTGQPKGVIIQHRAFATSAVTQVGTLQIRPQSRVLQFASFAFDVAVGEILTTLVQGGCLCMPSEEQRQQALSQAAYELKVNWAFLTPSVARVLRPADFPTLRTLVLAGEAVGSKEVQMWSPMLNLILGYGPAECAVWCSGTVEKCHPGTDQRSLGRWFGCRIWIVDPEDPNLLVPLGATGELVIDGPIIGRGYLNDPSTTRAAFLEGPRPWLDGKSRLLYRTGDLARYKADGTLQFVARKDLQVKLRGQRFELAEVEHHLRQVFDQAHDTLAEVATTSNGSKRLVAFIHLPDPFTPEGNHNNSLIASATHSFRSIAQASETQLHMRMPGYMVPTLYLPLQRVPLTNNGKLDRRRLREAVGAFSLEDLEAYSAPATARTKPSTPVEQCLQQIWSDVLDRPANTIGVEDNFFRLGGDSLRAMSLIRGAREAGYTISVADVFNSPRLRDLSQTAISTTGEEGVSLAPFALVPDSTDLIDTAAEGCNVPPSQIEDIYPCTPLQEGLMALSTKSADRYKVTFRYQLYVQVDLDQFQSAWIAIAAANPILRTRMIQSDYHPGTFQVVLADLPRFHLFDNQKAFDEHIRACEMTLGNELVDLSLIQSCDSAGVQFCLTVHHAVYDGWTIPSLCAQVEEYYQRPQSIPSARPFNRFLEYVQRQSDAAAEYWRNEFSGLSAPAWPALPSARHAPVANSSLRHTITRLNFSDDSEYTTTTLIHLAWALVMSSQTESDDVVYGVTLNGRSAPLVGIEDMTGPTITTFPLRVRLGLDCDTVEDALSAIQRQAVDRMPFQQFGLQNIRNTSAEASQACQFQSHLGVQPASAAQKASNIFAELSGDHDDYGSFAEYAFVIVCHLDDADTSSLQLVVNYDPQVVSSPAAKRLLGQFAHLLQQLPENLRTPLSQLGMLSPEDKRQLSIWNREIPSSFDVCLHDLVLAHAIAAPYSPAISAWDGNLTYAQLTSLSGQLASQLRLIGVHPSTLVPLCFEKSKWAAITMLAVMRAGGACVPLDPGHPPHHIENIIRRSNAKVVLTSHKTRKLIPADCGASVKTIPLQGLPAQATSKSWPEPSCHDVAFVIFTSGSTGEPKGILMEHVNLCTSIRDHSPPMLISPSTRALHFASYAFDASIYELFTVLASGGCVCIPSDSDRLGNLAAFIREAHVNYAIFTPSILDRLLRPELVPGLKTVTFGGEAVTQTIVDTWSPHLTLINGYGPAEATICAAGPIDASSWTSGTIGPVTGGLGWITMPSDVSRLAPVGAVGELVIEGPVVTRGYLNDTERTAAAYISPPRWLAEFRGEEKAGRLYRTGDLVQYTDDGGIRFVGRKDTQIKLRGQRVELSHVEHHVQLCFTEAAEIVAEIVLRDGNPTLFAFIAQKKPDDHECDDGDLFLRTSTSFRVQVQSATARLKTLLPVYMVPAVFLRLARVPRTSSDKLDRRQLRDRAARLSNDQIRALSTSSEEVSGTSHPPQTARECLFQQLWGTVLNISMDKIGTQDDFFELGGDSIQAMKLTSLLRREGIGLNVTDIFAWPILADQARGASEHTHQADVEPYNPGSLLGIEDILPTTEFQHQFLEYQQVYYLQLRLPMKIDSARLEKACHAMVDRHPMLRSVFLPYQNGYLQMVLRRLEFELIQLSCDEDLDAYVERLCVENASRGFPCGTPYFQVLLVSRSPSDSVLVMRASHAQFDGESLPLMLQDLILVYEGAQLEKSTPPSFALFLRHRQLHANPRTYKFWEQYLQNAVMTTLGLSGSDSDLPLNVRRSIPLPTPPRGITISSLVKAAWAVVLAQVTGQQDLVFGHVLNGRDTPMAEAHAISGPCVTVSPIRITIPPSNQVLDLLHHTQAQYTRALPYAGIDFGTIRQHSTSWPENTSFSSLQTHQNGSYHHPSFKIQGHDCAFETRPIGGAPQFHVATMTLQDKLIVNLNISSRLGSLADIENLSDRLCSAIADLECGSFPSLSS